MYRNSTFFSSSSARDFLVFLSLFLNLICVYMFSIVLCVVVLMFVYEFFRNVFVWFFVLLLCVYF